MTQPTKRAPDAGDSAHIPSLFLRLIIFLAGRLRRPRPAQVTQTVGHLLYIPHRNPTTKENHTSQSPHREVSIAMLQHVLTAFTQ